MVRPNGSQIQQTRGMFFRTQRALLLRSVENTHVCVQKGVFRQLRMGQGFDRWGGEGGLERLSATGPITGNVKF